MCMGLTNSSHGHLPRGQRIFETISCTSLYSNEGGGAHHLWGQSGRNHGPTFLLQTDFWPQVVPPSNVRQNMSHMQVLDVHMSHTHSAIYVYECIISA